MRDATTRERKHGGFTAVSNGPMVNESNFPTWMQTLREILIPSLETFGSRFESDDLAPIHVALQWIRGPKVPRDQETEKAIDEAVAKGIEIPQTNQTLPWDPRICTHGYQFRDKIRRFTGCRELGLNLQGLRLRFHNNVEDMDHDKNAMGGSWDNLRAAMCNPENSGFTLWFCSADREK